MLAIFTTAAQSLAFADSSPDPVVPESPSTTAQSSIAADSTGQNSTAHAVPATAAATATETPAVARAMPTPNASGERMQEQLLRNQGYKLSMVRGEEKYCRAEVALGSRLPTVMHCVTVAEAQEMAKDGRDTTERLQRTTPGCFNPAQGGCGQDPVRKK
ncbi:MAG TPA: hypothetical protein VEG26_02390 [Steroidobacteraceae bacterium]|nr:hypothetical protein [Steroidobacteraceae bacterium]